MTFHAKLRVTPVSKKYAYKCEEVLFSRDVRKEYSNSGGKMLLFDALFNDSV